MTLVHREQARTTTATEPAPGSDAAAEASGEASAEAALRGAILDGISDAVVATDTHGRVIYWNGTAAALFGWSAEEIVGADLLEVLALYGDAPDAAKILRHLLRGGEWSGELFIHDRAGHSFPIHATASPIRNGDGRVFGVVGICRDMSRQRETERALRESEERLQLVHRAAVSVIWEWDLRSDEMRWNEAIADSFGYPRDEVESTVHWWEDRLHPDDRERVTAGLWETLASGGRFWTDEYRFRTGNGRYATVFDRAYVAKDEAGRPVRVVGTMLDLTERRRAHEASRFLAQSSMLLDLSLDYVTTLPSIARLAVNDVADFCILAVTTGERMVEHVCGAHEDPARQPMLDRVCGRIAAGADAGSLVDRILRTGDSVLMAEVPSDVVAGESLDPLVRDAALDMGAASIVAAPMIARGAAVGLVILARHHGNFAFNQEDLRVTEELGRRTGLAVDNARLFQSAALARRAKSDFLAVVSHELRTPLTAISGYADLLAGEIAGRLNEMQKQQVARVRAGADRLLRLIDGILAYARLETGNERLQLDWIDLDPLVERVREIIEPQAAEQGVRLVVHRDGDIPARVCVDSDKLIQVLLSLLTNAVKFSRGGQVDLRLSAPDRALHLEVADAGPGIAAEHLPHVFSPFWQAEQPEVRRAGGAGLGLSVARRLARLMRGDVVVQSTSPAGTVILCRIPQHTAAS